MNISILIPIRNEEKYIGACLNAVLAQDYPMEEMEILVIDGMSTDSTREIISSYQNTNSNILLLDNPGQIVPTGMNIGLRHAQGDMIIRVDGHCVIAPDYVKNSVNHLQEVKVDGVGGPMDTIGETPLSQTIAIAMSSSFGVGNSSFRTSAKSKEFVDTVPFPAYTQAIIDKVGLYDEELVRNQDDEYNYRIRKSGGKLLLADDVRSKYYSRGSLRKLWRQYFQYGYYKVRVLQKHPKQMSLRQFIPPVFVLMVMISAIFSILAHWGWILFSVVIGSYIIANLTASFISVIKSKPQSASLLPLIYAIIHVGYGAGFLCGLVKFWNRWGDKVGKVPIR